MKQGYIPNEPKSWQPNVQPQQPPQAQPQAAPAVPQPAYQPAYQQAYRSQPPQPKPAYQPQPGYAAPVKAPAKRSLMLLIAAILGLIFFIVLVSQYAGIGSTLDKQADSAEELGFQLGTMIGAALLLPQLVASGIAVILNAVGWGIRSRGFALAGAIVYCVAAVLMIINAPFLLPSIVLSFVGFAKMGKEGQLSNRNH